jgi:hypothetical protein
MIWRRRKTVRGLLTQLRRLAQTPHNLSLLLELQEGLRKSVLSGERRVLAIKADLANRKRELRAARLGKDAARKLKATIQRRFADLEDYQAMLVALKTIGDGIAHCYFASHDLRTLSVKEPPGFITGKKGASLEVKSLRMVIRRGIPAVLCDLTNTLRYGDIVYPSRGGAPNFIEVKSGKANEHSEQMAKLRNVADYLRTDRGTGVYGGSQPIRRIELTRDFVSCHASLNNVINAAYRDPARFTSVQIESGLWYAAMLPNDENHESRFDQIIAPILQQCSKPTFFYLNVHKDVWSAHEPYTLSIHDVEHVLDFMEGSLSLFVILDLAVLSNELAKHDLEATFHQDQQHAVILRGGIISEHGLHELHLGSHMFLRIAMEFVSVSSFALVTADYLKQLLADEEVVRSFKRESQE